MIKSDFYPDYQTYSDNLVVTDTLSNQHVTTKTDDPLRAYYMGKLPNNKCKSLLWKDLKIVGTGDDKPNMTISLIADENRSMNWGYCMSSQTTPSRMYWANINEYYWACKLINSMQAYCLTTGGNVQITFFLFDFTDYTLDSGATIKGAGIFREYSPQLTSTEYVNWMENGTDLNLTFTDYGTITIKSQDCNVNGIWELGNNKYIIMHQIAANCETRYTGMSSGSYINPFYCTTVRSDGRFHAFSNLQRWELLDYRIRFTQDFSDVRLYVGLGDTAYVASGTGAGIISKSRDISVSAEALDYSRRQSENTYTMFGDKQTIMKTLLSTTIDSKTFYQAEMVYNIVPNDAYITYCLINKVKNGNPVSSSVYSTANTVGMFNSSNEPTGKRSSVTTYPALEPSLQQWQKYGYNINDDEYDPETPPTPGDVPPDEPQNLPHDEGEPASDQDNRTLTAPTCFITQYAMGYSQLQTVGVNLWQSWLTPNLETWKNFFFAFAQDTGTLDIGAALNFIISLRVFPFNLAGLTTDYISPTNGVYMGTGHTNFCPNASNLFRLNTVIGYLDCGTCEVVPETPYSDFRDMYNCSVLCFLPYCGTVELTPAEVIGRTLHVKYHIDFQSGSCTALVKVVGDKGEYTIASKSGQIGFTLPVTATNAGQLSAQFAKDATQTMGTIGGFFFKAAHAQADNLNSLANAFISKPKAINTDSNGNKSLSVFSNNTFETSTKIGEAGFNAGLSIANQALDMLSRSGIDVPAISGGMGAESMMQPDCCFVQIRRGKYAKPINYPHSQGYINGSSNTISYYRGMYSGTPTYPNSNNKGLCKFTGVDSTGLTCHDDERAEIISLLESGVYL